MANEYLTLQEASELLRKSPQTLRRMIKKGELKAERIRTPQGFQYAINRAQLPHFTEAPSPASSPVTSPALTDHDQPLTSQKIPPFEAQILDRFDASSLPKNTRPREERPEVFLENDFYILDAELPTMNRDPQSAPSIVESALNESRMAELVYMHHKEKMMLITILERLQAELYAEKQNRKGFFERLLACLDAWFRKKPCE